jgi:hypothetical protein
MGEIILPDAAEAIQVVNAHSDTKQRQEPDAA